MKKNPANSEVLLGTFWELGEPFWNLMGTYSEDDGDKSKKNPPLLPRTIKLDPWRVHAEPFIGSMELLFPKLFVPIFGLG